MDTLHLAKRSTPLLPTGSDAKVLQEVARCHEQQYCARFGMEAFAMYETALTAEQVARVESLMGVPMDELAMWDDREDRAILGAQRLKRDLENEPMYREKAKKGWAYWSVLFGSQVNSLRR